MHQEGYPPGITLSLLILFSLAFLSPKTITRALRIILLREISRNFFSQLLKFLRAMFSENCSRRLWTEGAILTVKTLDYPFQNFACSRKYLADHKRTTFKTVSVFFYSPLATWVCEKGLIVATWYERSCYEPTYLPVVFRASLDRWVVWVIWTWFPLYDFMRLFIWCVLVPWGALA